MEAQLAQLRLQSSQLEMQVEEPKDSSEPPCCRQH